MKTLRLPLGLAVGMVLTLACLAMSQNTYKDSIYVGGADGGKVTFYDFRSDRSNPEFEQPNNGKLSLGMVDSLLDKDHKPVMGSSPYMNYGVRFWFRDNQNLSRYQMYAEKDPTSSARGYLEKFRPIYRYRKSGQNDLAANYTIDPPGTRERVFGNGAVAFDVWRENAGEDWHKEYRTMLRWIENQYGTGNTITNAFQNVVIDTSLVFLLSTDRRLPPGTYVFEDNKDVNRAGGGFFPLNNKGLTPADNWAADGNANQSRNYSYTMELEWEFTYKQSNNSEFTFKGDDDVWVFVGDRLVLDIGGIHEVEGGTFRLNDLRTGRFGNIFQNILKEDEKTTLKMFYCERHSQDANIYITTNIIQPVPAKISIDFKGDTLVAGVDTLARGIIINNEGDTIKTFPNNGTFTWTATDVTPGGPFNNPNNRGRDRQNVNGQRPTTGDNLDLLMWSGKRSSTNMNKSDSARIVANKAYTYIEIKACYSEPGIDSLCALDTVYVKPGPTAKLYIEKSGTKPSEASGFLWKPDLRGTIIMNAVDNFAVNDFYAVLRDQFDNWVGPAVHGNASGSSTSWTPQRADTVQLARATNVNVGQGVATRLLNIYRAATVDFQVEHRVSAAGGAAPLTYKSDIRFLSDSVKVVAVRIVKKIGGTFVEIPVDETIRMTLPSDTTLYALVLRSDDRGIWTNLEPEPVNWTFERIGTDGTAPSAATGSSYTFSPTAPVVIRVTATKDGVASDPVRIRAEYDTPVAMRFFNKGGTLSATAMTDTMKVYTKTDRPTAQKLYPVPTATLTVTAGDTLPIVAAMFGTNPPAANSYIPNASLGGGSFTWSIVDNPDANATKITKITLSGDSATFRSTRATSYNNSYYVVRGTYTNGTVSVTQELRIIVKPGDPAAVYIEPESQDDNKSSLNKPLTFNGSVPVLDADGAITQVRDTLTMTSTETSRQVYALIRDKWGNYIAPSGGENPYWPTYVEPTGTTWSSSAPIDAAAGNPSRGQGIVTKDTSARTPGPNLPAISARDNTFPFGVQTAATLPVKILGYSYTELKVTDEGGKRVDSLNITTNDEPTLVVWGKKSGCITTTPDTCWEKVTGDWGRDGDLQTSLQTPPPGTSWKLDPRNPGKGIITVSRQGIDENGTPVTIKVDVPVVIELGPPTRAELVVVTPEADRKAGYPIKTEVRYFNRTGEMTSWDPSWTSTGTAFADDKGVGNTNKAPTVASKGKDTTTLWNPNNPKNGSNATLVPGANTGKDTVTLKLYNATNANPHTISYVDTIVVNGKKYPVSATATLTLLPGDPAKVVIVDGGGNPVKDSISIPYDGGNTIMQTVGEDEWGNRTGDQGSTWCVNGAIPTIGNTTCTGVTPIIVYDPSKADQNGCGWIVATPPAGIKADSVYACITGIKLAASDAITQDNHGCGYINAIKLWFPKKVELVTPYSESQHSSLITIVGPSQNLYVSGIVIDRTDSTIVTLEINETRSSKAGIFQTGWKPKLTIAAGILKLKGSNPKVDVDFTIQAVRDGAAPVITKAERFFDESGDKKKDRIVLHFSEPFQSINGIFTATEANRYKPDSLFRVWELKTGLPKVREKKLSKSASVDDREYTNISDRALAGLSKVNLSGETLWFALETEYDIKPGHFINMKAKAGAPSATRCAIRDRMSPQNVPDTNNRRAPVVYGNDPPTRMIPVPNPASPDKQQVGNSGFASNGKVSTGEKADAYKYIGAYHNPEAIPHIRAGGGGAVFQVPVYIPGDAYVRGGSGGGIGGSGSGSGRGDGSAKIRCQVKVYDLAGNLVSSGETDDMLNAPGQQLAADAATSRTEMNLFWSGFNAKGMKAAPGTYRIIVQLSYTGSTDPEAKNQKYQGTVGIAK